jgi:hypothetical protein
MTERRRFRHRRPSGGFFRHSHDSVMAAAGIAVLAGAVILIGVDAATRGGLLQGGGLGLDASAPAAAKSAAPANASRGLAAALLPGEIVVESSGLLPDGQWKLGDRPMPAPPVVLDSVAAGSHRLSFSGGDSIRWNAEVSLTPGGIAHVVVPELAPVAPAAEVTTSAAPASATATADSLPAAPADTAGTH